MPSLRLFLGLAFLLLVGFGLGFVSGRYHPTLDTQIQALREDSPTYKFTNPILLTQSGTTQRSPALDPLNDLLQSFITTTKKDRGVSDISVYFRDMDSGAWTGVNEAITYAPGSMLKVAIMMAYLHAELDSPGILDTVYPYNPQVDEGQYFKPAHMLKPGRYSVRDLIKNMIIESDNTATLILGNQNPKILDTLYKTLNLPSPETGVDFMSPIRYATLWRVLYNATYLSKPISEDALNLLSLTTFDDGLVAGLPSGTRAAHKFGEHTEAGLNNNAIHELHDCGIIYPNTGKPYFLCVMTRGASFQSLEKAISDISKLVYETVAK